MRNRETRLRRAREITSQINRLAEELNRILQVQSEEEEESVQPEPDKVTSREVSPPRRDPRIDIQVGDRVEISNGYRGLFGATKGSKGRVIAINNDYVDLRLESNGKGVTRKKKNVFRIPE